MLNPDLPRMTVNGDARRDERTEPGAVDFGYPLEVEYETAMALFEASLKGPFHKTAVSSNNTTTQAEPHVPVFELDVDLHVCSPTHPGSRVNVAGVAFHTA
jgi:hypothetical protein